MAGIARLLALGAAAFLAAAAPCALHAQTVITNTGVAIVPADVRMIYIGEKQFAGAVRLVPVDNNGIQDRFLTNFLKVDNGKYYSIWAKKSFREGVNPPVLKATDGEVVDFVRRTPGAVGYIGDPSKAVGVALVK
ncbi:MAG TPA: hypothetical protein VES00_06615 [Burkholderiaceae bacterium]|jgi:hypothetical protein|nr:hypothetical protein [Burkholderiaceae bacterium]